MKYRTDDIMPPPIVKLAEAAKRFIKSPGFLNLGQGLPGHIPPDDAITVLKDRLSHPATHVYTPDEGLLELREELSLYLRQKSGIDANPQDEIIITAGANNAFLGAILTLVGPNQNIIMPTPYYFNSVMAVKLLGADVKEAPVNSSFQPRVEDIEAAIDKNTRAIFIITPNNPTGAVYEKRTIDGIVDLCIQHDIMLISDETYSRMVFDDATHYSPRSRRDAENHVVTLGSFSKDFGMSGWRVGFTIGSAEFIREFLKVQDSITICAPTAGQMLALEVLKKGLDTVEQEIQRLSRLRDLAYLRMREIDALEEIYTKGTFYLFPRVKGCTDSRKLVTDILQSTGTLILPGSIFGDAGEGHVRISIGPLTPEAVDEAFDRLSKFFNDD
ncbi:MAG: putative N-acetyl-LL-diaminopimelate aminotransferase [Candidatus Thorarchaeota archaeon AB_25]|nr:MAG: putative N-acetyl-LL-diaminopimelate aminotransferase [Candidatus Thorarchaeota archaeon AB_25]